HLLKKPAIDAILDLCEEISPDLLVMGSRGLGTLRRVLVGSVSEGVVHHAPCTVLVVRGGEEAWPPTRLVVGYDGSDAAERAAGLAAEIGRLLGIGGVLVQAHQRPPEPIGGWRSQERSKFDDALVRAEEHLNERAERFGTIPGDDPRARLVEGDPALALLKVAEEGDESRTLLAVGSRGLGAISRTRLGSVSTNLLRVAHGPILVCPRREAE
ncbi:MAG TPA: universal stress protein, partial [Rubrobacteraceae bacterium]|nr:universal stress protein [Rubrobacteraceae bacterium]